MDNLQGGLGNDLLVSGTVCEGDILQGADRAGPFRYSRRTGITSAISTSFPAIA